MTSKISTRNLIKLEIKQTLWMFVLSCLAQFMAGPVLFLLSVEDDLFNMERTINRHCVFLSDTYFLAQILVMILCICFTIFSYRYLFSKRMTDLYHSVPITRGKLFLIKYVHGFCVWFIPFVLFGIVTLLMSLLRLNVHLTLSYLGMITLSFCETLLFSIFCFFVFYHLYLAAVYLSGNVLNMFANVAIMGLSAICLFTLCLSFTEMSFDTFCLSVPDSLLDVLFGLSPFAMPFYLCALSFDTTWTAFFAAHPLLLPVSFVVAVLLLVIAKILADKRPSELAERGTLLKSYTFPAKFLVSFMASLAFALFFCVIGANSMNLFWGIFGAIFGGVLCYGALNSIFHTTIKAFFKNIVLMTASAAAGILLVTAFLCDFFHYDDYLPKKEQIAGVAIYNHVFSDGTQNINLTTSDSFGTCLAYHTSAQQVQQKKLLTDKNACYDLLFGAVNGCDDTHTHSRHTFYVKVQLENGRTYYRRYAVCNAQHELLKPFIESEDYKNTNYKLSSGLMGYPEHMDLDFNLANVTCTITGDTVSLIMDAFVQDFQEHYRIEELSSCLYHTSLRLAYKIENGGTRYFNLDVPISYTRTTELLRSLYPDYADVVTSADDIINLCPTDPQYVSTWYGNYEDYFQTEKNQIDSANSPTDSATETVIVNQSYPYGSGNELHITDPALIELIFPYLTFAHYGDYLDLGEYISFGTAYTTVYNYIPCYVKANTVPAEIIDYLNSFLAGGEDF